MKKPFIVFTLLLVLANSVAGVLLYYVYFPWSTDIDFERSEQVVRSDLLDLNLRLSTTEYRYSKALVDKASFDLNREIKQKKISELELPKEIEDSLNKERYQLHMENDEGPIGILKLKNGDLLVMGPYSNSFSDINSRDGVVYLVLLFIFNYLCVYGAKSYLKAIFLTASNSINRVSSSIYLDKKVGALSNVSSNTPVLADKIIQLQHEHQRSLRNQRDLMHAVAHEFRGPMARINFAVDLITNEGSEQNKGELKTEIEESLEELDSLVKEVLDYSRLKDGQQKLNISSFAIKDAIEDAIKKVSLIYASRSFNINLRANADLKCQLDQHLVERALLNLIRNAAKFSLRRINVNVTTLSEQLIINIEDDGSGVPPGKRERIFEPFTRLEHSRSRDSGGAGLGLAIVKSIANRHNGTIIVKDSEELGGASFILTLPLELKS